MAIGAAVAGVGAGAYLLYKNVIVSHAQHSAKICVVYHHSHGAGPIRSFQDFKSVVEKHAHKRNVVVDWIFEEINTEKEAEFNRISKKIESLNEHEQCSNAPGFSQQVTNFVTSFVLGAQEKPTADEIQYVESMTRYKAERSERISRSDAVLYIVPITDRFFPSAVERELNQMELNTKDYKLGDKPRRILLGFINSKVSDWSWGRDQKLDVEIMVLQRNQETDSGLSEDSIKSAKHLGETI